MLILHCFCVFENKNIQGENMDRHFFSTSSDFLNEQLQNDIFSYIKENELYSYELLYNAELDRAEDKMGLWEPYYGNSKNSSSQVFSRYKNDPRILTDTQLKLISENMSKDSIELFFGFKKLRGINKEEFLYIADNKFLFFFNKMLEDAFIMDSHYEKIIDTFVDYIPFSKYISKKESYQFMETSHEPRESSWLDYLNCELPVKSYRTYQEIDISKQYNRQKLLMDSDFAEIFWNSTIRLLDKINLQLYSQFGLINNFENITAKFFKDKKLLLNTDTLISQYFEFIYERGYLNCKYSTISDVSYGEIVRSLLKDSYNIEFDKSKSNYIENPNQKLFDLRYRFGNEVLIFADALENIQMEIDKEDKKVLERLKENNIELFTKGEDDSDEYEPRFTSPFLIQCSNCRFSNLIDEELLNKYVSDYYVFVDLFCRHCDAELEVRISILEELKLQIDLINCSVIDEPEIHYFEKDYGVN